MSKGVANWLNKEFLNWQVQTGKKQTLRSFAEYLDVKETSLSGWMRGVADPQGENVEKIAARLGPEIYDELGLQRPDPIEELQARLDAIPNDRDDEAFSVIEAWLLDRGFRWRE